MTTQHYLDSIKQVFPQIPDTQILKDIDKAQKLLSFDSELLTAAGQLSNLTTTVGWTLPSDFLEVYGNDPLRFYDSDGYPLYISDYNYAWEIRFGILYIYSTEETPITGLDSGIDTAYIFYRKKPTTISSQDTALEIDESFRDAIEHYVLKNYFAKFPVSMTSQGQTVSMRDWNAVSYHSAEYEKIRRKALAFARKKEDDNSTSVVNYQYAGLQQLPQRTKDATLGATTITQQLTSLGQIYDKFTLYNINTGNSGEIAETIQVGYTTIAGSKTGTTFTVTSTAEFGNDTFVISNHGEVSFVQNSSSEIVITLPSSFTDLSIQIFEYS